VLGRGVIGGVLWTWKSDLEREEHPEMECDEDRDLPPGGGDAEYALIALDSLGDELESECLGLFGDLAEYRPSPARCLFRSKIRWNRGYRLACGDKRVESRSSAREAGGNHRVPE
jgi:hypothetical protein